MAQTKKIDRQQKVYWKDFNKVKYKLNKIKKEIGHFPSSQELKDQGYSTLYSGIKSYHGGFINVRRKLKQKIIRNSNGYWEKWENFKQEIQKVIEELGHFPVSSELETIDRYDILVAANRHWENLDYVRKRMGYTSIRRPKNYWEKWGNLRDELKKIVSDLGYFPSQIEFQKMELDSLNGAINRNGGIKEVKNRLEKELTQKLDTKKSWYLRDIERKLGINIEDYLREHYV